MRLRFLMAAAVFMLLIGLAVVHRAQAQDFTIDPPNLVQDEYRVIESKPPVKVRGVTIPPVKRRFRVSVGASTTPHGTSSPESFSYSNGPRGGVGLYSLSVGTSVAHGYVPDKLTAVTSYSAAIQMTTCANPIRAKVSLGDSTINATHANKQSGGLILEYCPDPDHHAFTSFDITETYLQIATPHKPHFGTETTLIEAFYPMTKEYTLYPTYTFKNSADKGDNWMVSIKKDLLFDDRHAPTTNLRVGYGERSTAVVSLAVQF